jgi:hypothetical protein
MSLMGLLYAIYPQTKLTFVKKKIVSILIKRLLNYVLKIGGPRL